MPNPNHPKIEEYRSFGDERPPRNTLQAIVRSCNEHSYSSSHQKLLVAAHACGDLIMYYSTEPGLIRKRSQSAHHFLDTIIDKTNYLKSHEDLQSALTLAAPIAVKAVLQKSDISSWKDFARGCSPEHNYEQTLQAARQAMDFAAISTESRSNLTEFMPLLLGSRARHQGATGWSGRLALLREGNRPRPGKGCNPNWDVGLCFPDLEIQHTLRKPMRVQAVSTERQKDRLAYKYRNAGVACISAQLSGFDNPEQIVLSCMNEFEVVPQSEGMDLLSTGQLDDLTHTVEAQVRKDYARAVIAAQAYNDSLANKAHNNA